MSDWASLSGLCLLSPTFNRASQRARHVLTENARVLAARGADARAFGELMNASHQSLRDDYAVSVPRLDLLVSLLQAEQPVYGAKLTGAGFGGACVALCEPQCASRVAAKVLEAYSDLGGHGRLLLPAPSAHHTL